MDVTSMSEENPKRFNDVHFEDAPAWKKCSFHHRPAYSGGFQPAPSRLEKHYNYLDLLLILRFRA